jgi:hypothetical protein
MQIISDLRGKITKLIINWNYIWNLGNGFNQWI